MPRIGPDILHRSPLIPRGDRCYTDRSHTRFLYAGGAVHGHRGWTHAHFRRARVCTILAAILCSSCDVGITTTTFTATLQCVNGAASGSISATWDGSKYIGTWTFGGGGGNVRVEPGLSDTQCMVP